MSLELNRRTFFGTSAAASLAISELTAWNSATCLAELQPVVDSQLRPAADAVAFRPEIEWLVRLIEDSPRENLLGVIASRVKDGLDYQQLLAALFLAGIRNVQPRPAVGFKFHAVLVVNSAHLASLASPSHERWLPIFWALDEFKKSQARDVEEGNWTMPAVNEDRVPSPEKAVALFSEAMQNWDESAADVAAASVARSLGANQTLDIYAQFVARDFRSIGHKPIYLANSWRTLQTIGWRHAEPVLRSLAYAALNHTGESNPSRSDLEPDRSWLYNESIVDSIRTGWSVGKLDDGATAELLSTMRQQGPREVAELVARQLGQGVSPISVFDAIHTGAAELLLRQNGIVALHATTTANAMRFLFDNVGDDRTRRLLLLQAAAFLPQFRNAMLERGQMRDVRIAEQLTAIGQESSPVDLETLLATIGGNASSGAELTARWLAQGNNPLALMDAARRLIFFKGNDSHDYKFSSAVLEDFYLVSPAWRNHYLAGSTCQFRSSQEKDNGLITRIVEILG